MKTRPLASIAAALVLCTTGAIRLANAGVPDVKAGQDPAGKAPYEENCRKCHGVRGTPPKTMKTKYPKIATFDAEFFEKRTDDSVVTVLTKGKNEDMKSFKDKLSHDQMVAVAAYIRSFAAKS